MKATKTMPNYRTVAVSINGRIFYHPCDGSAAAIAIHAAAVARGDTPYTHLFEGDIVADLVQNMLDEEQKEVSED